MLQKNSVKQKIANNEVVFGILNSTPLPLLVEMIGYAGYDFIILDQEHLLRHPVELEHAIRAAECANMSAFVRVPGPFPHLIQQALDAGAQGIVVPRIEHVEQAQQVTQACRYPGEGNRGITGGRNTGFGQIPLAEYTQLANQQVMLVLMIESVTGVKNLPEILAVPGIDMILEGAMDLAFSMGHAANAQHIEVQQAIADIALTCKQFHIPFCAIPRTEGQLTQWRKRNINAFVVGEDRGILFRALQANLAQFKNEL
ncbi:HpcH/HpaI aldolase family protein [Aliikangiella maris]|uniref:Aldolase/citrate lyase family protein n=2 Tax=Aliikangiella maris TaxID=3162458 RepID=A0ABV2BUC6_9GAMM